MCQRNLAKSLILVCMFLLASCNDASKSTDIDEPPIPINEIVYDIELGINEKLNKVISISGELYLSNSDNACPSFCRSPEEVMNLTDDDFMFINIYAPYSNNGGCNTSRIELSMDEYVIPISNVQLKEGNYRYSRKGQQITLTGQLVEYVARNYCDLTEHPSVRFELSQSSVESVGSIMGPL